MSQTKDTAGMLTRRQLLRNAAGTGLVLLLPVLQTPGLAAPEAWTTVGPASQFVQGKPQKVTVAGGGVLYITRQDKTTLVAVSAKCTHHGCEIGWNAADTEFHCPCHGAVFAKDGKNVRGTRHHPEEHLPALPAVPVREHEGQVQVNLQKTLADGLKPTPEA